MSEFWAGKSVVKRFWSFACRRLMSSRKLPELMGAGSCARQAQVLALDRGRWMSERFKKVELCIAQRWNTLDSAGCICDRV